jgi:hypothetical protein
MKATFELILAALYRVQNLCDKDANSAILTPIAEAVTGRTNLKNIIIDIEAAKAVNLSNITDITVDKLFKRNTMTELVLNIVDLGYSKSVQLGKVALAASLNVPRSSIILLEDSDVAARCEELRTILKNNLGILTNITQADLDAIDLAIKDYVFVEAAPKDAIEMRKAIGTDRIPVLIEKSYEIKKVMIKIFKHYIPDQAHAMDLAGKIGKPIGTRYLSINVLIKDSLGQMPLKGVKCTLIGTGNVTVKLSTVKGFVKFYSLPNALWSLQFDYEGYQTAYRYNIATKIKTILRITIPLLKITPPSDSATPS